MTVITCGLLSNIYNYSNKSHIFILIDFYTLKIYYPAKYFPIHYAHNISLAQSNVNYSLALEMLVTNIHMLF